MVQFIGEKFRRIHAARLHLFPLRITIAHPNAVCFGNRFRPFEIRFQNAVVFHFRKLLGKFDKQIVFQMTARFRVHHIFGKENTFRSRFRYAAKNFRKPITVPVQPRKSRASIVQTVADHNEIGMIG